MDGTDLAELEQQLQKAKTDLQHFEETADRKRLLSRLQAASPAHPVLLARAAFLFFTASPLLLALVAMVLPLLLNEEQSRKLARFDAAIPVPEGVPGIPSVLAVIALCMLIGYTTTTFAAVTIGREAKMMPWEQREHQRLLNEVNRLTTQRAVLARLGSHTPRSARPAIGSTPVPTALRDRSRTPGGVPYGGSALSRAGSGLGGAASALGSRWGASPPMAPRAGSPEPVESLPSYLIDADAAPAPHSNPVNASDDSGGRRDAGHQGVVLPVRETIGVGRVGSTVSSGRERADGQHGSWEVEVDDEEVDTDPGLQRPEEDGEEPPSPHESPGRGGLRVSTISTAPARRGSDDGDVVAEFVDDDGHLSGRRGLKVSAPAAQWGHVDEPWLEDTILQSEALAASYPSQAHLEFSQEPELPFTLVIARASPPVAMQAMQAFVAFLSSIPTPPRARIELNHVPQLDGTFHHDVRAAIEQTFSQSVEVEPHPGQVELTFAQPDPAWQAYPVLPIEP